MVEWEAEIMVVSWEGRAEEGRARKSSPYRILNQPVMDKVDQWLLFAQWSPESLSTKNKNYGPTMEVPL